ncbi:MAG: hypothetical protein JWR58_6113 [Pseudonocardia sp.]|nr:hypothetical protein [Pseudonocardia sp.]
MLLVLDNFEDNLTGTPTDTRRTGRPGWRSVRDPALAHLLAAMAGSPGSSALGAGAYGCRCWSGRW